MRPGTRSEGDLRESPQRGREPLELVHLQAERPSLLECRHGIDQSLGAAPNGPKARGRHPALDCAEQPGLADASLASEEKQAPMAVGEEVIAPEQDRTDE